MDKNMPAQSSGLKTMQLNDQKAGMQGLNKDVINKIIYEASKGTPYFAFQEKRQKSIDSKVAEINTTLQKITEQEKKTSLEKMTKLASMLEIERDLSHSIVHIDMDAFYAAVEMEDNPALKEKPMAVGSSSMLSTSNYLARKSGVRAAMPGFIAKKLCPDLIIVPCNFDKYRKISRLVKNVIKEYDPNYSSAGLDEFYLDLTEFVKVEHKKQHHLNFCIKDSQSGITSSEEGSVNNEDNFKECLTCSQSVSTCERDQLAYNVVTDIRKRIQEVTNLTASAGIAPNTMLAKVCSDQNKPNGQYQITSSLEAVHSFIHTLPVKKVSGIGPVQSQILNAIGIFTCSDMWEKRDIVGLLFSPTSVDFYMRVAVGIGSTTVKSDYVRKSIGTEHTFKEMSKREELFEKCQELCEEVIEDLIHKNMLGKVVVLKIKTTAFVSHTRNYSLSFHTCDKDIIVKAAKKLLDAEIATVAPKPLQLRLMGIRICNLIYEGELPSIEKHLVKIKNYLKPSTSFSSEFEKVMPESKENTIGSSSACSIDSDVRTDFENNDILLEENTEYLNGVKNLPEEDVCSSPLKNSYNCPVCNFNQSVKDLVELNAHIDACLNKVAIKSILAEDEFVEGKRKLQQNVQQSNIKYSKKLKTGAKASRKIEDYFH